MIPKLIHQIWLGDVPMHPLMVLWREKWKSLHPNWKVLLWESRSNSVSSVQSDLNGGTVVSASPQHVEMLVRSCHLSQRSNIWRYLLMKQFGGVYADTDVEPYKPIDNLVGGLTAFVTVTKDANRKHESSFFGGIPNQSWLIHLVDELKNRSPEETLSMGTGHLTLITRRHPEVSMLPVGSILLPEPSDWNAAKKAAKVPDVVSINGVPDTAYAIHHWSSLWFSGSLKPLKL